MERGRRFAAEGVGPRIEGVGELRAEVAGNWWCVMTRCGVDGRLFKGDFSHLARRFLGSRKAIDAHVWFLSNQVRNGKKKIEWEWQSV